ncbi:MAG: 4Fe-4S binding protein [Lachnospiraceae bacterium]|nr:4Fe-4S binding protein [Lachnospiraceae bacterium]
MKILKVYQIYFSPTGGSERIVKAIGSAFQDYPIADIDLTDYEVRQQKHEFKENDLVIICAPVYGGRLPAAVTEALEHFHGINTPTILTVSYGCNTIGDALLELKKIMADKGFTPAGAGYFAAQHTYLKELGQHRPDAEDVAELEAFGKQAREVLRLLVHYDVQPLAIPGQFPYEKPPMGPLPFTVETKESCFYCGLCINRCPVRAISKDNPKEIDSSVCIRCGACMQVCPAQAKFFSGDAYGGLQKKLEGCLGTRKENWFQMADRQK